MGVVIRQSIKGTIVTYVGASIGFFTTMFIMPKYLGKDLYGLIGVLLEAGGLFAIIFQLGVCSSAIRFFPHFKSDDRKNNGFFFYIMLISTIGFLLFIPLFFLLKEPISHYFQENASLFVDYYNWLIPLTFFLLYWSVFEVDSSLQLKIVVPKFIREVLVRILTLLIFLLYGFGLLSIDTFIACFISIYGIVMLASFFYVSSISSVSLKHDPTFITKPLKKEFFSYTSFIILGSLGGSLISKVDTFMITGGIDLGANGIYRMAFYIISIIEIPSRSITTISIPLASEALRSGDFYKANELYQKVSLHQLMIASLIFLIIWVNIDNIYAIIPDGETFKAGKWVVFFIGLAKIIEVTLNFGGTLIGFSKYYRWTLYFVFFITGITILMNYFLLPIYGISGAALATVLSCLISYGCQQWLIFVKIKGNPFSWGTLKQLLIILSLFILNYLLPTISNPFIDGIYRTLIIAVTGIASIYVFHISEDVNMLIRTSLDLVKRKIGR